MTPMDLRLHHLEPASRANGPGLRAVLWLQGCTLGCPGCFNPQTHPTNIGRLHSVPQLAAELCGMAQDVEGVTISGGEPLQQMPALTALLELVRRQSNLSVVLFSGYTWQEIEHMPAAPRLLAQVDVLIAGRYQSEQRLASGLIGSTNKTLHFLTARYTAQQIQAVPPAEVIITADGEIHLSGIEPLNWEQPPC